MPRAQMVHDGSAGYAVSELGGVYTKYTTGASNAGNGVSSYAFDSRSAHIYTQFHK